jgi:hypothetical protein
MFFLSLVLETVLNFRAIEQVIYVYNMVMMSSDYDKGDGKGHNAKEKQNKAGKCWEQRGNDGV